MAENMEVYKDVEDRKTAPKESTPPMLCVRSVDLEGYRPERGKTDVNDEIIEDRLYICRNRYREY